jgi:hypothetical protein
MIGRCLNDNLPSRIRFCFVTKKYREKILPIDDDLNPSKGSWWNSDKIDWRLSEIRTGRVQTSSDTIRLSIAPTSGDTYSNAQISNYSNKRNFPSSYNISMTLQAHLEPNIDAMRGTAGFGFWNQPFVPNEKFNALPKAAWFFFAPPPNNMKLALNVLGSGWKAATIDVKKWQFLAMLPTAPIGFVLMRFPMLYRLLWPIAQRTLGVSECLLDTNLLSQPHTYAINWFKEYVEFKIDSTLVHKSPAAPRGRLGFVAWIDNQYAVVTPQGSFKFGLLDIKIEQSLVITKLKQGVFIGGDEYDFE